MESIQAEQMGTADAGPVPDQRAAIAELILREVMRLPEVGKIGLVDSDAVSDGGRAFKAGKGPLNFAMTLHLDPCGVSVDLALDDDGLSGICVQWLEYKWSFIVSVASHTFVFQHMLKFLGGEAADKSKKAKPERVLKLLSGGVRVTCKKGKPDHNDGSGVFKEEEDAFQVIRMMCEAFQEFRLRKEAELSVYVEEATDPEESSEKDEPEED